MHLHLRCLAVAIACCPAILIAPLAAQVESARPAGLFAGVVQGCRNAVVGVRRGESFGTGVIISADGSVLTAQRVAGSGGGGAGDTIEVLFADGRIQEAALVGADRDSGLALLRVRARGLPYLEVDGDLADPRPGERVALFSNATNSIFRDYQVSCSIGTVHALLPLHTTRGRAGPALELEGLAANPGTAGGAVVDLGGRLRGILNGDRRTGVYLGHAIPVRAVAAALERLRGADTTRGAFIGGSFKVPRSVGLVVMEVPAGSPVDRAGLRQGDLLLAVAGRTIDEQKDLEEMIVAVPPGTVLPITISREGRLHHLELTTTATPELGYLGIDWDDDGRQGLRVGSLKDDSPLRADAERERGLRADDRVLSINGFQVNDLDDLERLAGLMHVGASVVIAYRRGGEERELGVKLEAAPATPDGDGDAGGEQGRAR